MAIATKTLYQTEDGKEFETELEAKAHETALQNDAEIEAFLDSAKLPKQTESGRANGARARAKNIVALWLAHQS
jgi:hypothetical protein